ncbi:ATP-binding protein [Phaeobacter sp. NW0010-22]|uniref:ATP-binding protein n=1 Tax=Phaeobacter sp. NW0010-22 TaxID=3135907 RepID=UPI0031088C3C
MSETSHPLPQVVSRRRYERALIAREEAERLLEAKSRELYEANQGLLKSKSWLEKAVQERTVELEAARIAAESANAAKSVFLASMSHEIRTPLNGIFGMALALSENGLTDEQNAIVDVIRDSGSLLLSVINDILDLSKIEAGKLECEHIPCGLGQLLGSIEKQYQLGAQEKGLEFRVSIFEGAGIWVKTDATRLRQVVGNLLSNAIKFTDKGSVAMLADIIPLNGGWSKLTITITDTGPGIPKDQHSRLFKPFSQANSGITRNFGGTGLGLVISRRICQEMGGALTLKSDAGQGAEFVASVLVEPCDNEEMIGEDLEHSEAVLTGTRWRILAAEDNRTNRLVLHHMLKRFGMQLEMSENGEQLISRWRAEPWDLILMDVNMPVMDGLRATQIIRDHEHEEGLEPIPIIAVSANAMSHQVNGYLAHGITDHVAKPLRRAELVRAMATALTSKSVG